jgi:ribosomal protein L7/L12
MDDHTLRDEVLDLLSQGQKIAAVKLYRDQTGSSLADAKAAVEAWERGDTSVASSPHAERAEPNNELEQEIVAILGRESLVKAVKHYRERTGAGLKASKEAVQQIAHKNGLPSGSGCLSVILLAVIVSLAAAFA